MTSIGTEFALDTSGRVAGDVGGLAVWYEFEDLLPFAQGYIEALFADLSASDWYSGPQLEEIAWQEQQRRRPEDCPSSGYCPHCTTDGERACKRLSAQTPLGFSDFHPSTLAAILKDCERFTKLYGEWPLRDHGEGFWKGRQKDKHSPEFPPQTPSLDDEGKVLLS